MGDAGVKRSPKKTAGRFGGALVLALTALALLLAPAEASAQFAPQPWGANDRCSDVSWPEHKFGPVANGGWSYLNVSLASGSAAGSVGAVMFGTLAECVRQVAPHRFEVQTVCEFHCLHDHTTPYPWTVELFPTGGNLLGWPGTNCLPRKEALRSSCVVQMPAPGATLTATAMFGTEPDSAPPSPPVASPGAVASYSVSVSWSPSTDAWLAGYDITHGGTVLTRVGPGTTSARLEALSCQTTYNIQVVAFDARNATPSNTVPMTTGACVGSSDTRAPNTVFHVKPPKVTRSRTASFHFGATERSRFRCKLDRRVWTKCRLSDPYVLSMGKTYRRLKPGYHTFRVRAIDRAGNADRTPAVYRWRIRR